MINPEVIVEARRALGRQLAAYREAAGLIQEQLAPLICYGRSTIANAETGYSTCGRAFWERCDQVLNAEGALLRGYEEFKALTRQRQAEIAQRREAERVAKFQQFQQRSRRGASRELSEVPGQGPTAVPAQSLPAAGRPDEPWSRLAYVVEHPDQLDEPTVEHWSGTRLSCFGARNTCRANS